MRYVYFLIIIIISAADFGVIFTGMSQADLAQFMAQNRESLTASADQMAAEALAGARDWDFIKYAPDLARRPLLLVTSDDGLRGACDALASADRALGGAPVTEAHIATDHSYSDHRIALETAVIHWLDSLPPAP